MAGIVLENEGTTPVKFSVDNNRRIAFTFPDSKYWLMFDEVYNTFKARIEAVKLCKYYDLECVIFAYVDEVDNNNLVKIVSEKGALTADMYSFKRFITSPDSRLKYEYLNEHDIFGEPKIRHSYWRR